MHSHVCTEHPVLGGGQEGLGPRPQIEEWHSMQHRKPMCMLPLWPLTTGVLLPWVSAWALQLGQLGAALAEVGGVQQQARHAAVPQ